MTNDTHHYDLCPAKAHIDNLSGWQKTQNGLIKDTRDDMKGLRSDISEALEALSDKMLEKHDKLSDDVKELCEGAAYKRGKKAIVKKIVEVGLSLLGGGTLGMLITFFAKGG